jgi:hypothetical protein
MKVKKIIRKLNEFLDALEDLNEEQEISLRSNTYQIGQSGDLFLGFTGYDGGYLTVSDIESKIPYNEEDTFFANLEEFVDFVYDEIVSGYFPGVDENIVKAALNELFYGQEIEELYELFFDRYNPESSSRDDNIASLIEDITELVFESIEE